VKASERDAIIDDLLLKRPVGPKGVNLTFTTTEEYCYDTGRYRNIQRCDTPHYGYDVETLFDLGLHDSSSVSKYVRDRWFAGKSSWEIGRRKSTITRRANRIWERIGQGVRHMKREGGRGIYAVRPAYGGDTIAYIFGSNPQEAISVAATFIPPTDGRSYRADFKELGGVEKLRSYNEKLQKYLQNEVKRCEEQLKTYEKKMSDCTNRMTMLNVLAGHQVALETDV